MNYDGYHKYDELVATTYDQDREIEEHWKKEGEFVKNHYRNKILSRILDIPVGTGRFIPYYSSVSEVYGVDISEDMLKQAIKYNEKNIHIEVGDALKLRFNDEYFDEIVCFRLVHLIPSDLREQLFTELTRITRKSILIQIYLHRKPNFLNFLKKILSKIKTVNNKNKAIKKWSHIQSYRINKQEFDDLLIKVSLKVDKENILCKYIGSDVVVYELSKK